MSSFRPICPHCSTEFGELLVQPLPGIGGGETRYWHCIALCCPFCKKALGAELDSTKPRPGMLDAIERSRGSGG
jgi:hypothetical protein